MNKIDRGQLACFVCWAYNWNNEDLPQSEQDELMHQAYVKLDRAVKGIYRDAYIGLPPPQDFGRAGIEELFSIFSNLRIVKSPRTDSGMSSENKDEPPSLLKQSDIDEQAIAEMKANIRQAMEAASKVSITINLGIGGAIGRDGSVKLHSDRNIAFEVSQDGYYRAYAIQLIAALEIFLEESGKRINANGRLHQP